MGYYKTDKRNSYTYSNGYLKNNIDNNEFVKNIRKKLMEKRLKEKLSFK